MYLRTAAIFSVLSSLLLMPTPGIGQMRGSQAFAGPIAGSIAGSWIINYEETDKVAVDYKDGSGMKGHNFGKPQVTIMGIPLPGTGRKPAGNSGLAAKDPKVLRTSEMTISITEDAVVLDYDGEERETMVPGNHRGRHTRVSDKSIRQKYKTTSRTVTKTWELRDDGRLQVAVKLNPKNDKARTYTRVFDRAPDR